MDFFKNFINQVVTSMPIVTKVAYVNTNIKQYLKELEKDSKFNDKFIKILKMFISKQISQENLCAIVKASDGIKLSPSQIEYFCNRIYDNEYILDILNTYATKQELDDFDINYLSEFLVIEINNIVYCNK